MQQDKFYDGVNVLVTGADGFIGSHLTEQLLSKGANVRALALYNSEGKAGWLEEIKYFNKNKLEIVFGDIRDGSFVHKLCKNIDVVFHLAALISIPYSYVSPNSYMMTNVQGTINILEASLSNKISRVITTSTSEIYGTAKYTPIDEVHQIQAQSPYSASKISADHFCDAYARSFGVPVIILRPFNTFGPRQSERAFIPNVIRQILDKNNEKINVGDLSTVRDFIYVTDVAEAYCIAGKNKNIVVGQPYNISASIKISMKDVLEKISYISGIKKEINIDKTRIRPKNSEVYELFGDSNKFRKATNWKPVENLETGLMKTIDWWKNQINEGKGRVEKGYQI